jgi:AAA+ ATPase superfamily predicted ATPase
MNIYGRKQELKILKDSFESNKPELIPVYGRRRIGKTWLVNEFCMSQECLYFKTTGSIYERGIRAQIFNFLMDVKRVFGLDEPISDIKTWASALELLANKIHQKSKDIRIILFFDELPWFIHLDRILCKHLVIFGIIILKIVPMGILR